MIKLLVHGNILDFSGHSLPLHIISNGQDIYLLNGMSNHSKNHEIYYVRG